MSCSSYLRHGVATIPAALLVASGASAGPVLLIGDAADSHGAENVYAGLIHETLTTVSNGQVGILALGVDPGSAAGVWLLQVSALLPQTQVVAFVNDATIGVVGLSGYGLLYVPSPSTYTAGGITQAESDLLNSRAGDVANFLDAGGGIVALTQGNLEDPYGFLGEFAPVTTIAVGPSGVCGGKSLFDDVTPTEAGAVFGITDTNLDGCCWGNVYAVFPEEFTTLATAEAPGCPTINGTASILVGFVDIPEIGFDPPDVTPADVQPKVSAVADLDSNGTPDVVAVGLNPKPMPKMPDGLLQVFLNQGVDADGIWGGLLANAPIAVGNNPSGVAVGLFNNDAHLDIAVTNADDDNVQIFFNDPKGPGNFIFSHEVFTGDEPSAIAATDFTEDGFVDLAVANALDEEVVILVNDGSGIFSLPESVPVPLGFGPANMLFGDFDGNKCPDIAGSGSDDSVGFAGGETQGQVFVLLGQGGGVFDPPVFYDVGQNPTDISIGDLNDDGFPDLATSNQDDSSVSILVNVGDGTGTFELSFPVAVGDSPTSVDIVDINVDARPDLAVVADDLQIGPAIQVLENQLDGSKGGTIPFTNPIPFSVGDDPNFVANGDFNGDGLPDLVTVNEDKGGEGSVAVLLNNPPPPPCPGDFNDNGFVNVSDLLELLANWGPCPPGTSCPWDLNGDGVVDIHDFLELLFRWGICAGEGCPWDLNGDGVVNGLDVAVLLQSLGDCEDPDNCPADLDGDGHVGLLDLLALLLHLGDCE